MSRAFNWKHIDRNLYVHPLDEDDVLGGPKPTDTWFPDETEVYRMNRTSRSYADIHPKRTYNFDPHIRRPVVQLSLEGIVVAVHEDYLRAAASVGRHPTSILRTLRGDTSHTAGFRWEYAEDDEK